MQPGDHLLLDDEQFTILAVGDVANANLLNLGHVSTSRPTAPPTPKLPGRHQRGRKHLPVLHAGQPVAIVAGDQPN